MPSPSGSHPHLTNEPQARPPLPAPSDLIVSLGPAAVASHPGHLRCYLPRPMYRAHTSRGPVFSCMSLVWCPLGLLPGRLCPPLGIVGRGHEVTRWLGWFFFSPVDAVRWRNLGCGCEGWGSRPRSTTDPAGHSYLWFSVCGRKETWQTCDDNLYTDGHHSLIQRPLFPDGGCSFTTEYPSRASPIREPGTSVGPVPSGGGGGVKEGI